MADSRYYGGGLRTEEGIRAHNAFQRDYGRAKKARDRTVGIFQKHPANVTEKELLDYVIATAYKYKVLCFHSTDSRKDHGPGFPDLVLCGSVKTIFVELKTVYGSTSPDQTRWKWRLLSSGQDHRIWTPNDLEQIERRIWELHQDKDDTNVFNGSYSDEVNGGRTCPAA